MNKQKLPDSKRYSILTNDLTRCIECGKPKDQLHEVFFGRNREKSKVLGCVIPLCVFHHQVIHNNRTLDLKWKIIAQKECMDRYDLSIEEFIKSFGRNYIIDKN